MPTGHELPVLVVEDNASNRLALRALLDCFRVRADFVASGPQAIAIVQSKRYGLILMDLMLPGMDGYEASRQIRRLEFGTGRHTPIVAVTAVEPSVSRPACIAAGIDGFIAKPFEPDALAEVLQRWIFRRREERAEARH